VPIASRQNLVKKLRVQLDLTSDEIRALDALRTGCGLRSRADAVRTALGVLEWIHGEARKGNSILAVGDEDIRHLVVPGLTTGLNASPISSKE
jgi:hypothetical protein